jgi:hypothetical protein
MCCHICQLLNVCRVIDVKHNEVYTAEPSLSEAETAVAKSKVCKVAGMDQILVELNEA